MPEAQFIKYTDKMPNHWIEPLDDAHFVYLFNKFDKMVDSITNGDNVAYAHKDLLKIIFVSRISKKAIRMIDKARALRLPFTSKVKLPKMEEYPSKELAQHRDQAGIEKGAKSRLLGVIKGYYERRNNKDEQLWMKHKYTLDYKMSDEEWDALQEKRNQRLDEKIFAADLKARGQALLEKMCPQAKKERDLRAALTKKKQTEAMEAEEQRRMQYDMERMYKWDLVDERDAPKWDNSITYEIRYLNKMRGL